MTHSAAASNRSVFILALYGASGQTRGGGGFTQPSFTWPSNTGGNFGGGLTGMTRPSGGFMSTSGGGGFNRPRGTQSSFTWPSKTGGNFGGRFTGMTRPNGGFRSTAGGGGFNLPRGTQPSFTWPSKTGGNFGGRFTGITRPSGGFRSTAGGGGFNLPSGTQPSFTWPSKTGGHFGGRFTGITRPSGGFRSTAGGGGFNRPRGTQPSFTWPSNTGGNFGGQFTGMTRPNRGFRSTAGGGGFNRPRGTQPSFTWPSNTGGNFGGRFTGVTRPNGGFRSTAGGGGFNRPSGTQPSFTWPSNTGGNFGGRLTGMTWPNGGFMSTAGGGRFNRPSGTQPSFTWPSNTGGNFGGRFTGMTRPNGGFMSTAGGGRFNRPSGTQPSFTWPSNTGGNFGGRFTGMTRPNGGFRSTAGGGGSNRPRGTQPSFTWPSNTGGNFGGQFTGMTRPNGGFRSTAGGGGFNRPRGTQPSFTWPSNTGGNFGGRFTGVTRPNGGFRSTAGGGGFNRPSGTQPSFTWPSNTGGNFGGRFTGMTRPNGGFRSTAGGGGFNRPSGTQPSFTWPSNTGGNFGGRFTGMTRPNGGFRSTAGGGGFNRPRGTQHSFTWPSNTKGNFAGGGGFNRPSGTQPSFTWPSNTGGNFGGRLTGMTRPTGGVMPTVTPFQRQRLNYDCPRECQYCKTWRTVSTLCMAYDEFGEMKSDFRNRLNRRESAALNETSEHTVWRINARIATCEGMRFYLNVWADLTRQQRKNLITFIKDPRNITVQEMQELPRVAAAILNKTVEANMYSLMSHDQNKTMCDGVEYEDCITRQAILQNIDCRTIMRSSASTLTKDTFLSYLDSNKTKWSNEDWNATLRNFPDSMDYNDYKICPIDVLIDTMREIGEDCDKFDKKTKQTILNRTTEGYDSIKAQQGSVPQDVKDDWKYMVGKCGGSVDFFINKIDAQEALKTIDFKNMDTRNKKETMERMFTSVNISSLDESTIANSITLMVDDKSMLDQLSDTKLESALDLICKSQTLGKSECRKILRRVKKMSSFADASNLDATKVENARCLMPCYPVSDFNQIPKASLKSAIASGNMKNMTVGSKDQVDKIKDAAKDQFNRPNGDFTSDEVEKIGPCLLAFGPDALDSIPSSSFNANVSSMIEEALKAGTMAVTKAVRAKLAEKVKQSIGIAEVLASKNLADSVSTADIASAQLSDFTDLAGDTTEVTLDVDATKASILMSKIKTEIGDLSSSNFTLRRFKNLKKLLSGTTTQDIKNIPKDNTFLDKIHVLADAENMNREQVKTAYEEYKKATDFDATDATTLTSNTDSTAVDKMSTGVLMMHNSTELKKYGTTVCLDIVKKLSTVDTKLLTKTELKDKFTFFLDCLNKNSGTITEDDLNTAGNLICGCKSEKFRDMDSGAMQSYAAYLDKYCSLDEDERSDLATAALDKLQLTDTSQITTKFTAILGTTITEFTDAQLSNMDKTVLSSMASTITADLDAKETAEKNREAAGFKLDRNDTVKALFKEKRAKVSKALMSAMVSSRTTTLSGRRKRSTTVYTCSELQTIGVSGLSVLTTAEINALADSTFTDCAETLGSVTDWSSDQTSALLTVAQRNTVWGSPSTWATNNVYSAGSIVQGMTSAEIDTLAINLDAISRLGQFSGWADTSIASVFSRYLSIYKSNDASTLSSSELRSLGHATCGATTSHISQIQTSVYQSSADAVGDVTSCQDLQLQEFATLAKSVYGSTVSSWDTYTISTVGTVIGGLSKAEIATLSELQINAIDANDVSYIPATAFSGFTTSQISTFSNAQAQATTASQRSALSSDQLAALETAAGVTFTADSGNSGDALKSSVTMAVLLAIMSALLLKN